MAENIEIITPYGPEAALHWYFTDREILWQTLKELIDHHGCRGVVMTWPTETGEMVYLLEGNDDAGRSFTATLGQHLVMVVGDSLTVVSQQQYEYMKASS